MKIEGKNRGGGRDDTCDHDLSRSWKVDGFEKEKKKKKYCIYDGGWKHLRMHDTLV